MNTRFVLRLLAVALVASPGVRLLADDSMSFAFRTMTLDLIQKQASEASERQELRATRKEAPAQPSALSAANFDANKDGKLDDAEFAKWTAALRQAATKSPEAMKRFDKNRDGKLDDAEWAAALTELFGPG